MWGPEGHAADVAALERLTERMLGCYARRRAARAEVRYQESFDADPEWNLVADEVYCTAICEGLLLKVRHGSTWILGLSWSEKYGMRVLTQGSREDVERCALDVTAHGPPGGPEFRGQPGWLCNGGDDTLHAVTIGGEFRLMPLIDGGHLLMFARNDFSLCVLGVGEREELQRTAHERLATFSGDALRVRVGHEWIPLRGVGGAAVLGHLECFNGAKLVLGHLAGDAFVLCYVRGEYHRSLGVYTLAELRRGDLGQALGWAHGAPQRPQEEAPGVQPPTKSRPPPQPRAPARPVKLTPNDWALIDRHLTLDSPPHGPASTVLPRLLEGLRALARLGFGNQQLRASGVRRLLAEKAGIEFFCCSKTFGRALARAAAHSRLVGNQVGSKLWSLRFGDLLRADMDLLRWIAAVTPAEATAPAAEAGEPAQAPSQSPPAQEAETTTPTRGETPTTSQPSWASQASSAGGDGPSYGPSEHDDEPQSELDPWLTSTGYRRRYRPGALRATLSSLPAEQSASRWPGKKSRGPP